MFISKIASQFQKIEKKHHDFVARSWLGPLAPTYRLIIAAMVMTALAVGGNFWVRYAQLASWTGAKETSFLEGAPSFSTADAPFYLEHSKSIFKQESFNQFMAGYSYPNHLHNKTETQTPMPLAERPLLSVLIWALASKGSIKGLLEAGNHLVLASAVLTALMIIICFGAAGYWLEGSGAALGGALSSAYLVRSSIGRIDTDQLNLGFMYLLFGLSLLASKSRSLPWTAFWCSFAGLTAHLFMWWYNKPELVALPAISLVFLFIVLRKPPVASVIGVSIFIFFSGISPFNMFEYDYGKEFISVQNFIYPNVLETVTEARRISLAQIITLMAGSIEMGLVCLAGLALFLIRHPMISIAYGPLMAFALLNFWIGNRAVFYSAPIFWFGAAFLLTSVARFIAGQIGNTTNHEIIKMFPVLMGSILALVIAWVSSPTDYIPKPSFSKPVLSAFISLKDRTDPKQSIVTTWWDYGYASRFLNDLPVFHSGGSQTTPSTFLIADAFLNDSQEHSVGTLKFLSKYGNAGIAAQKKRSELHQAFTNNAGESAPNLYVVVTGQMAGWISSISQISNWDIETGTPITPSGNDSGPQIFYEPLNCQLARYPQRLNCASASFDLERGIVNGVPALAGWAHSRDGALVRRQDFKNDGDFALQIVQIGKRIKVFFMHRQLFESTFNELYHLGQIDHPSISLHYDDYPHIRIYEVRGESKN